MLFQYIGDGADAPAECELFDHVFVLNGEPVNVTNPHAIHKLMGNKSFMHEPVLMPPVVTPKATAPAKKQSRR